MQKSVAQLPHENPNYRQEAPNDLNQLTDDSSDHSENTNDGSYYDRFGNRHSITPETNVNNSYERRSRTVSPTRRTQHESINKNESPSRIVCYLAAVLIIVLAVGLGLYAGDKVKKKPPIATCKLDHLKQQHYDQIPKLWQYLSVNIESILNKESRSPFVFLFLHQNHDKVRQLVKDIANEAADCFGNDDIINIRPANFTSDDVKNDYGIIIEKYKRMIKSGGVVLVVDLNEVPAEGARALHSICDTETPIVKDVVIFLSLVTENIEGNPVQIARDELSNLWSPKLQSNDFESLVTRVTDNVMALQS